MLLIKARQKQATRHLNIKTIGILILVLAIIGVASYSFWVGDKQSTSSTATLSLSADNSPLVSYQMPIVQTKTDPTLGPYLTDANGLTLYVSSKDSAGTSNCSGSCLESWPAYAPSGQVNLPNSVTVISRSDGTKQFAYKGMPLYYYIYDTEAGQISGNGVASFSIAKP
jgi:predicted lipoprotein with Yx(FWY)xxD motif